jgi:hypothetical protein
MLSVTRDKGSRSLRHEVLSTELLKASIEGIEVELACWSEFPANINTVRAADKMNKIGRITRGRARSVT